MIVDYIFDMEQSSARKGIGDVMGGKVLELYTEKRFREGEEKGKAEGKTEGLFALVDLIQSGVITIAQAAASLKLSVPEFIMDVEKLCKIKLK